MRIQWSSILIRYWKHFQVTTHYHLHSIENLGLRKNVRVFGGYHILMRPIKFVNLKAWGIWSHLFGLWSVENCSYYMYASINILTIVIKLTSNNNCDLWSLIITNTNISMIFYDFILFSLKWQIKFEYFLGSSKRKNSSSSTM